MAHKILTSSYEFNLGDEVLFKGMIQTVIGFDLKVPDDRPILITSDILEQEEGDLRDLRGSFPTYVNIEKTQEEIDAYLVDYSLDEKYFTLKRYARWVDIEEIQKVSLIDSIVNNIRKEIN